MATSLPVTTDGVDSNLSAIPIMATDLAPAGYAAESAFPIVPTEIIGPFMLYFVASPIDINTGAQAIPAVAGQFYGLEDWSPTVATLE